MITFTFHYSIILIILLLIILVFYYANQSKKLEKEYVSLVERILNKQIYTLNHIETKFKVSNELSKYQDLKIIDLERDIEYLKSKLGGTDD